MAKRSVGPISVKLSGKRRSPNTLGSLSFLFGAVIAIIVGVVSPGSANATLTSLLIVLGIIVGFLNVTTKEANSFLLASVSLVIVSALGGAVLSQVSYLGLYLEGILMAILTFVIPASIIVAIKSIYSLEEER